MTKEEAVKLAESKFWENMSLKELLGEAPMPSFSDVLNLIPEDKRIVIAV